MALSKVKTREVLEKSKGLFLSQQDRKVQTFAIIFLFFLIIPVYIFALWVLPFSISTIIKYAILVLLIGLTAIFVYVVLAQKIPSSDRICRGLALLENEIENESYSIITKTLGKKIYRELNPTVCSIDVNQTDLCKDLLKQSETIKDTKLKFHIYLKLYKFYYMSESFDDALGAIRTALEIDSDKIIVKIWLAEAYEYTANGKKAIDEYESIKKLDSTSSEIRIYIDKQVERIKQRGPGKAPPVTGLRYMSY